MLIMLGLDSQFGQVEIVAACLIEHYPQKLSRFRELVVLVLCVLLFLMGLSCVTNGGIFVFNLFDSFSAGLSLLFIVFLELIVVAWIYGVDRFSRDVEAMIGHPISKWWLICWKYLSPLMVLNLHEAIFVPEENHAKELKVWEGGHQTPVYMTAL